MDLSHRQVTLSQFSLWGHWLAVYQVARFLIWMNSVPSVEHFIFSKEILQDSNIVNNCLYSSYWLMEKQSYILWTNLLLKTQSVSRKSLKRYSIFPVCNLKPCTKAWLFHDREKRLKILKWLGKKSLLSAYKGILCFSVVCVPSEIEIGPPFSFFSFFPIGMRSSQCVMPSIFCLISYRI